MDNFKPKQIYFKLGEIENICSNALKESKLYPKSPEPVRIDRFIERYFNITHEYENLGPNILGYTEFRDQQVSRIVVSADLDLDHSKVSERRVRTTLAHEAGHVLLHSSLFTSTNLLSVIDDKNTSDLSGGGVLCREENNSDVGDSAAYNGKWWEYQANRTIGAMLMPIGLVKSLWEELLPEHDLFETGALDDLEYQEVLRNFSDIFDVNPIVANIRIDGLPISPDQRA